MEMENEDRDGDGDGDEACIYFHTGKLLSLGLDCLIACSDKVKLSTSTSISFM